jgi:phosphatidylserine/phosphatidylglycerophosphate/cardiolipin synthase-like enzyme
MKPLLLFIISLISLTGWTSVNTYFNHNASNSYTEPYRNIQRAGDNLEQVLLDQISLAKKTIYIAVQELRLPLVAEALVKKSQQGVDVRIVLEHDYNFTIVDQLPDDEISEKEASKIQELKAFVDLNKNGVLETSELQKRDAIYILRKAGIPLIDDTSDQSYGSALMHHKFMVVDNKTAIVSTANFTMSCIHGDTLNFSSRGNANSLVVVESSDFARLFTQEFAELWGTGRRGRFGQSKTYRGPKTINVDGINITVQFSPTSRELTWENSVNGLIARHLGRASRSVKAALFVFSEQPLADVLEKVSLDGAEIGVLIERKFAYRYYSELLDMLGLKMRGPNCSFEFGNNPWKQPIEEAGYSNLNQGDVLHHKFAVVDNKTVIVGSQNWSDSANYMNDETLIVIQDNQISDLYTQEYERLKARANFDVPVRVAEEVESWNRSCTDNVFGY